VANLGYGSPDGMVWYGMVVSYLLLYLSSITLPAKFFAIASEIICFFVYISFSVCFCVSFICVIYSVYKLIMIITRLCIECKSSPRHLTSPKVIQDLNPNFQICPDLDLDVYQISAKLLLIDYFVGVSYFAESRENQPVSV